MWYAYTTHGANVNDEGKQEEWLACLGIASNILINKYDNETKELREYDDREFIIYNQKLYHDPQVIKKI